MESKIILYCFISLFVFACAEEDEGPPPGTYVPERLKNSKGTPEDQLSEDAAAVLAQLRAIDGLEVSVVTTENAGYARFDLGFSQPLFHDDADGVTFTQRAVLHHISSDVPMVFASTGYSLFDLFDETYQDLLTEPTVLLGANQLLVEHRFFGTSRPDDSNMDWNALTVEAAATDHHHIIEAIRAVYLSRWIGTGVSKGGMTQLFQEYYYPNDLDGAVAYVAPILTDYPDLRFSHHFDQFDGVSCFDAVKSFQVDAIERTDELVAALSAEEGAIDDESELKSRVLGAAMVYEWEFWQYFGHIFCDLVPPVGSNTSDVLTALWVWSGEVEPFDAEIFYQLEPVFYQDQRELGYPHDRIHHLEDALAEQGAVYAVFDPAVAWGEDLPWKDQIPVYSNTLMVAVLDELAHSASDIIAIYGEYDPWTGGPIVLDSLLNSHVFIAPQASHEASFASLDDDNRALALERLYAMAGVADPSLSAQHLWPVELTPERQRAFVDVLRRATQ